MVLELHAGGSAAWIHPERGGRLGQLDLGRGPLLRGPGPGIGWADWGAYPLAPWANRLPDGRLTYAGERFDFVANWPDRSAIHGLVADVPWEVLQSTDRVADLRTAIDQPPYRATAWQQVELSPGELRLALRLRNDGDQVVPVGLGLHPWFRAGPIAVPAASHWPGEPLPTGPPVDVDPETDLRQARVPPPMDRCYTDLVGSVAQVPGARLSWEGPVTQVVVYTGEPGWVAVEPVTMANDGFRLADADDALPHGVRHLAPGAELEVAYRFSVDPTRRAAGSR